MSFVFQPGQATINQRIFSAACKRRLRLRWSSDRTARRLQSQQAAKNAPTSTHSYPHAPEKHFSSSVATSFSRETIGTAVKMRPTLRVPARRLARWAVRPRLLSDSQV